VYLLNHPPTWVGSRWTLKSIGRLVQQEFGLSYDRSSLWHLLKRLGWRCQKPDPRNRTKEAIAQWRAEAYALAAQSKNGQGDLGALSAAMRKLPRPQTRSTWVPAEPRQKGAARRRSAGRCPRQQG
jgi:transposase